MQNEIQFCGRCGLCDSDGYRFHCWLPLVSELIMTRSDLIEVLSFVPGFTTDILTSLPSERLVELYSDYFEDLL